ncbi:hypothetical protein J7295_01027 [Nakaseomyces glabratus]|nr:hypothetical protein J7295_01027 [Nakaseomyces glabratus]
MKYLSVFATFVAILSWACATVYPNFYKDKTIVLDGMGTEEFTIPRDKILSLVNTSLTLKNFAHISIKEGVLIQEKSSVTIIPPIGASRKFNFTLGGVFDLENESKFIFDGSGNTYEDEADAVNNFVFDIYANSSGIQVYKGNTVSVTLPTIKNSIPNYQGESPHIRFAGSTLDQFIYKPPYVLVSLMIIAGKFEVLSPGSKTGSQFDKVIWRVDFGVSGLAKTNPNTPSYGVDKLTGEITCEGILAVYNDMFAFTNNAVLHTLGYIGYSVVSPITLDLSMGPIRRPTNYEYLVALPAGQDGITLTGYKYTADTDISDAHQYLFYYFYDNDATKEDEISVSTDNSDVRILHSNPSQTVTVHGDSALNIGYYKGDRIDSFVGFDGLDFSKYKKELAVYFYESFQYSSTTTTKSDEYTTEIIEIIVSGTLGIDNKPSPVTISSTIYNQLRETTETVDLGNGVTEYHVLDYFPVPQDDKEHPYGTSTKIITYSPPPVTITATTAADYVETDWISFFITTNDKGEIITDSTLFNATRDYNLPEAPHTSFGPAPPAETKTVDLGNEVTEYLVISYWTTTNEFGGLITTSSTRTYSPPPVTITATTAADYVETDWISFFITTNDKGEIITDSTLFNATRDYNLPEAPHTSFGPAPPAETKTVDLGNEVTEYLVISYWTTTNEFGGLITTSSTRTYSPPPVTITATTAADYVETDWISFFITTNDKGEIITDSTLFNATRDYNLPEAPHTSFGPAPPAETKTVDLGNEVTEYLVISYWTTTNEFGGLITTSSTRTYSPPPVTITATTAADYVETDWISFFITTNDKGEIITDSTLFNATRDYNLPEAPHTSFGPAPPAETKTVDLGNEVTEYLVISYWTTTNEFGGLITTSSTRTYSPPPVTITATTAADYVETDWISFFITTNDKGEIITDSTLFNATRDYNLPEAPHTSFGPAPPAETKTVDLGNEVTEYLVISYWTTTNEFGGLITTSSTRTYSPPPVTITATTAADYVETDWISFFITTNDKGEIITDSTLFNATRDYNLPEAPHTSFGPAPPAETKTVDLGNEVTEYLVISYWTTTNEFGGLITTSSTRTYSPPPVTITATTAADYVETDWISFFITTNDKGEIITDSTLFNATREYIDAEAPHLSSSMKDVLPESEADYTTTIDKGNGEFETDLVSHITTKDSDGKPTTITTTIPLKPSEVGEAGEADYTTTIISDGHTITEVVSHVTTTDSDGKTITYITTMASYDQVDEGVFTSAAPYSQPPVVTSTITEDDGSSKTVVISYFPSEGEDGVTRTGTTTVSTITPGEADYTTTIISDGHTITEVVSHVTTTDSDGKTITYITTMASYDQVDEGVFTSAAPYSQPPVVTSTITEDDGSSKTVVISYFPSEGEDGVTRTGTTTVSTITPGEADYTTTIISDGHTITEVVSHVTTTDSDGKTITYITTMASYDQVDEGVFTSAAPYSQPPVVTSTITEDDGSSKTVVISYFPSEGEDGVTRTGTTTVSTITPGEADYTTTIISDGHTITEVVSHVTTTDSDGKTITYITTTASYDQVDEGVFTSAAPYSQPPVVTSTITEDDGSSKTVVISYFPSEGEDGVTRTGTTTVSTITPGEADYTTTIISDGHTITEVVSHVTTTDSDGKTITYTTTIFSNDWLLVDSELDVKSNHPTSVVSKENPYTTVDSQSTISSNSGNTVVTTKTPANGNENHGLSSVNGTSVSSGRNTIPSVSLIITNTLGFAGPINKPSYSTTSASSSVPQEVARDSSKYGENVSSVGIMLPQMSKPHASSASISVVHSSSRPVISRGSRPSDVSARPTENTPTFGSMPVQSGAENDASVSSTNDNQNTHTAQSRLQQLGKTSSDLGTTALLIPSSSAVNISHTGGPSDTQIASVLQGSGFKIKANKSEVMILLVTVFLFLGMV